MSCFFNYCRLSVLYSQGQLGFESIGKRREFILKMSLGTTKYLKNSVNQIDLEVAMDIAKRRLNVQQIVEVIPFILISTDFIITINENNHEKTRTLSLKKNI